MGKRDYTLKKKKHQIFGNAIDRVSFSSEIRRLVEILNSEIEAPERVVFRPNSNPAGFARLITKRRLTIAEAYIKLMSLGRTSDYHERIEALDVLMYQVLHARNLSMPINTARVQIVLMKSAVKMRGNRRRQLELMSDFSRASYGQPAVIRRLLKEHDLIEVPETGEELSSLGIAWDDHVHDSLTEGRKSPSHLVLDAFIKGMSRIVVAYYDLSDSDACEEIFLAAKILGVRVQVGVGFSVGLHGRRQHYLYIPPQNDDYESLRHFCESHREALEPFWQGIRENASKRQKIVCSLLESFNETGLVNFNEASSNIDILKMSPISWESVEQLAPRGQTNRIHLGLAICEAMRPILLKRMLYLKNQYRTLLGKASRASSERLELERCRERYEAACDAYYELSPIGCVKRYVPSQTQIDYDSSFETERAILPILSRLGGGIVFSRPLEHGFQRGIDITVSHYEFITDIEVFNLSDYMQRNNSDMVEIRRFASFLNLLSKGEVEQIRHYFEEWQIAAPPVERLREMCTFLSKRPFVMRCASDAVGWASNIPGMGFAHETDLMEKTLKQFKKSDHPAVPEPVAQLLKSCSGACSTDACVYLLSNQLEREKQEKAEAEGQSKGLSVVRIWRYLNVNLKCLILAGIGFIPAYCMLGWQFALLWFVLTGSRNAIVDLISLSGFVPKTWSLKSIDKENLCTSLFFTGFSVPIMTLAKHGFDLGWTYMGWEKEFVYTFSKFWCIALANGLYLASHNTLRGFEKSAVRGNFFRNVLSWPLATMFSYFCGSVGVAIPDVVQAKICSEVVGGVIEGTTKHLKQNRLAVKSLFEVLRQVLSSDRFVAMIARIDILYFWSKYPQGRRALTAFMDASQSERMLKREKDRALIPARRTIYQAFTTEGSLEDLTSGILSSYPEEDLQILTDFVGETHDPFLTWLKANYEGEAMSGEERRAGEPDDEKSLKN